MCKENRVCSERALTFETMLTDPLIRLVMDSDGVSMNEMVEVLSIAREAIVRREMQAVREMGWV
jgi:hypothetical protein